MVWGWRDAPCPWNTQVLLSCQSSADTNTYRHTHTEKTNNYSNTTGVCNLDFGWLTAQTPFFHSCIPFVSLACTNQQDQIWPNPLPWGICSCSGNLYLSCSCSHGQGRIATCVSDSWLPPRVQRAVTRLSLHLTSSSHVAPMPPLSALSCPTLIWVWDHNTSCFHHQ